MGRFLRHSVYLRTRELNHPRHFIPVFIKGGGEKIRAICHFEPKKSSKYFTTRLRRCRFCYDFNATLLLRVGTEE